MNSVNEESVNCFIPSASAASPPGAVLEAWREAGLGSYPLTLKSLHSIWHMARCSREAWRRLAWVAFIFLRLVYVLFFAVACFAFDRVSSLLGQVEVCGLRNSTLSGPPCTDMSPVIQGCLMSSVLSFLVVILHTAVELALRARGPLRHLCGETAEYGQGFLAMLRVCIVFVLLQTTVSFLGVAMIVRVIEPYGELSLDDNCSVVVAAGVLAALACTLTVLDAAVRALSIRCQPSRFDEAMGAPLSPDTPHGTPRSAPRWRVRGMSPRPQTVSASTSDWRVGGPCAYTGE